MGTIGTDGSADAPRLLRSERPVASRSHVTVLTGLADRLIVRHLRVSIPDWSVRQALQRRRVREPLLERKVRCIAIVGAGASAPLLARGDALATELEERFAGPDKDRKAELFRLQRLYQLNPKHFETRLAALSRTPEATQHIRHTIAKRYRYRHPTILGYELLAHLLKHRFLDAIISFNFDELLDQSLDDELGADEYQRIVSDRDCAGTVKDPDSPGYLPLYIKLHGTAAEPDSLRFTREAYYQLPHDMTDVVETLFDSQRCVIVNVGSAMTGLDLHRLLRIPEELEIYDLSPKPLSKAVCKEIASERSDPLEDSLCVNEKRPGPTFALLRHELPARARNVSCDHWLTRLVREIERRAGPQAEPKRLARLVRFRSVDRHEAVADVLGPETALRRWTADPESHRRDYVEYLKQRTIVELALSGAKARGLAQLSWLAIDRCGTYYELYRREARDTSGAQPSSWKVLRTAAGLDENEWLLDVVQSEPDLCIAKAEPTFAHGTWALREFVPSKLAAHVAQQIGNSRPPIRRRLTRALYGLQSGSEIEIQPTDDRVCSKAFDSPLTLPTTTSLDIFTTWLFHDAKPADEVYISCETGEWLLENEPMAELLSKQDHVEVITAFEFKSKALDKKYEGKLKITTLNPWRHNRHMTIICRGGSPARAVYFARRLRTPLITPVYLDNPRDAARIMHAFALMRQEIGETIPVADIKTTADTARCPVPQPSAL
jgi:hypothetical protein